MGRGRFNRWRRRWWRFLPCWHTAWMARAGPLPLQNRDTEIYRGRLHVVSGSCRGRGSGGENLCTYIEQRRAEHSGVESVLVVPPPLTDAKPEIIGTRRRLHCGSARPRPLRCMQRKRGATGLRGVLHSALQCMWLGDSSYSVCVAAVCLLPFR